ncbi:MAG: CHAD domain-containing protein [Thiohalomonadaceae bacterium]
MANESQATARPGLSAQPVDTGLQTLLRQGWTRVRRAAKHFHIHPEDPEALHDLRVAMRRLRSLFQAFAPVLRKQVKIIFTFGRSWARDHEVSLSLL